jgi:hypothetical protein
VDIVKGRNGITGDKKTRLITRATNEKKDEAFALKSMREDMAVTPAIERRAVTRSKPLYMRAI